MIKVDRTFPAPKSLETEAKKKNGSYTEIDVVDQLLRDFHKKCYICEINDLQDPQVEHLLPHKNGKYPERKFDWNNLFLSCGHCNSVKNQKKYDEGIIDCCKVEPEKLLTFKINENAVEIEKKEETEDKTLDRTIELLQEVYGIDNTGMREYKSDMRFKGVLRQMNLLYDNLEQLKENPNSKIVQRKLKVLLRRESAFAAFKRYYIEEHKDIYPELQEYLE